MAIWNLGSVNVDHVYRVPHLPAPGETIAAADYAAGLGGKGANQSVAAALAGARVEHVGAVGKDSGWVLDRLRALGVGVDRVARLDAATGHAVIWVDAEGENSIVIHAGANVLQSPGRISAALNGAAMGDWLLLQNETSHQVDAARMARARGMRVLYSAAPFDLAAVRAVLGHVSILVMNAVEAARLVQETAQPVEAMPVEAVVITRGAQGASWIFPQGDRIDIAAFPATALDTTGAGDCFAGWLAAGLDHGMSPEEALRQAAAAAAIQVTRPGAADAMPSLDEVHALLASHG